MRKAILLCASAVACSAALGAGWQIRSARSLGMGGAGVALAEDAGANYWNPAALGTYAKGWSSTIDLVAKEGFIEDTFSAMQDIVDIVAAERLLYDLNDISLAIAAGTANDQDVQYLLRTILVDFASFYDTELGLFADAGGTASYAQPLWGGKFACSAGLTVYGEAGADIDLLSMALRVGASATESFIDVFEGYLGDNPALWPDRYDDGVNPPENALAEQLEAMMVAGGMDPAQSEVIAEELVYQSDLACESATDPADVLDPEVQDILLSVVDSTINGTGEFVQNETGVSFEGLVVQETRFAFGHPLVGKTLSGGIALNIMDGKTYNTSIGYESIEQIASAEDVINLIFSEDNTFDSVRLGVDVGLLFKPAKPLDMVSVGLVGHNVLPVEFAQAGGGEYALRPQWRAGVAVRPMKGLLVAVDMDLTNQPAEAIKDYKTQTYAAGVEYYFVPKFAAFRVGLAGDFLVQQQDLMVTMGLGVRLASLFRLDVGLSLEGNLSALGSLWPLPESFAELEDLPRSATLAVSLALNTKF